MHKKKDDKLHRLLLFFCRYRLSQSCDSEMGDGGRGAGSRIKMQNIFVLAVFAFYRETLYFNHDELLHILAIAHHTDPFTKSHSVSNVYIAGMANDKNACQSN